MIPSRPTTYRGVRMRSRLEAAFAEQVDRCDYIINWTYEPECFASPSGQYLPDFELTLPYSEDEHRPRCFVEVKSPKGDIAKAREQMPIIRESIPDAELLIVIGCEYPLRFDGCWSQGFDPESRMLAVLRNATFVLTQKPYWGQALILTIPTPDHERRSA